MPSHEEFMKRCLALAGKGLGHVAPNPMVGCVIVHEGKIIGEGYHMQYGGPHAEVNALASVQDKKLLKKSTLYVSLEPCAHFGKTPPCADLITEYKIPCVVIGCVDSNPLVKGKGIEKLVRAGIDVKTGMLENECREINKRFFTFQEKKRPYIILKWAQTSDGFIDHKRVFNDGKEPLRISSAESLKLSHQWRSEEQAIMVGSGTALLDNPRLTVREAKGKNPLRVLIDRELRVPENFHLLDDSAPTWVFTHKAHADKPNTHYITLPAGSEQEMLRLVLNYLYRQNIQSLIAEGGARLLCSLIQDALWDEARVFTSPLKIQEGVKAPILELAPFASSDTGNDRLEIFKNAAPAFF